MIYLHPSLGITNAPATPPRITDPSYIDRIYEFVGGNKAQFSVVIEASNGTVLDDIKETRLTAHLFDAEGRELTEHLTAISPYWEEHNETWTEVGRGWSYLVNDNSRFLRLLRVRVSQLDIMTALGATIDAETKKTLAGIMVQQEVKITNSSSIYNRIPSADLIHQQLVNDAKFRELVKGDKGEPGKDTSPIRPNLLEGYIDRVVTLEARNNGTSSDNYNYDFLVGPKWLEDGKAYVVSADFEWVSGEKPDGVSLLMYKRDSNHLYSHTELNGRTKARVSIYIAAGVHNTVGIAGYAGRAGKTRGVSARYSNIKLEEVQEGETKESTTYLPHLNDLKGEPGKSISIEDLGITWQGDKLVVAGKASQSLIGPTGPAGVQGIRGPQGIQGPKGAEGKPGAKGEPGKSISIEDLGITWQGDKLVVAGKASQSLIGPTGPAGVQGIRGPQGIQGPKGAEGKPGAKGEPGKSISIEDLGITWQGDKLVVAGKASQSLIGPTGPAGVQGIRGPQGIQGPKGAEGKPGAKGEPGKSISIEDLGITWQGDKLVVAGKASQSLIGPTGPAGVQGIRGPQGIQGPKGAEGKPGAKGEPGKSISIEDLGITWQGDKLVVAGKASQSLIGPTGPAGVQGIRGPQGIQGPKGAEGKPGAKGEPGKSISIEDLGITWQGDKLVVAGKASQSLIGPTGPAGVQGIRGPQGIQGPKGAEGKPGAKGEPGKSISIEDLGITWQGDKLVVAGKASQSLIGPTGPAGVQGIRGPQGIQGPKGAEGKPGAKGEPGKSVTPQEVADTINTADWQNQIASATASNIIKTPILSDKLRELVQPDTTELIKRLSSRTMQQDILSQNGGKYLINVPAFALFEPEVEDGAAISLQVSIRQPIGSCTNPNNHDERGYFFIVKSWEPIYTTSAEKLCKKGGEIKVYYDSEQCAESLLSIKLERSNDHWIFVNYYDFAASIQADCTQIVPQSHYSNKSQDEMLSYAPLQYLSGKKRNAVLPTGRVGIVIRVWANKWVGDVRVRTELGESLYNTSDSTGGNIGSDGALIPAGHIGEFICINEEKIWLYTDLSR